MAMNPADFSLNEICVVGCGRWMRRDDQAGLFVARALKRTWLRTARLVLTESPAADLLIELDGVKLLILVDAACMDREHRPGYWRRLDYHGPSGQLNYSSGVDSHTLGAAFGLELAGALNILPSDTWIYAIVAGDCSYGKSVTPPVADAIRSVTRAISDDVRLWKTNCEVAHA